jgi:hypothetical protein
MGFQVLGKNQELAPGPQFFSFEHPAPDPGIRITGFYPDKTGYPVRVVIFFFFFKLLF